MTDITIPTRYVWPAALAKHERDQSGVTDADLEIRPAKQRAPAAQMTYDANAAFIASKLAAKPARRPPLPGLIALHCASVTITRAPKLKRLVPRFYLFLAALPVVALAVILMAGAFAKAVRWAAML